MKVMCVFSLEAPHRGDSNEYTQYTVFNIKKKIGLNYPKSAAKGFFLGTQERVRISRGKRAISVRATEVLLYIYIEQIAVQYYGNPFAEASIFHFQLEMKLRVLPGLYIQMQKYSILCAHVSLVPFMPRGLFYSYT